MRIINLDKKKGKSTYLLKKAKKSGAMILTPSATTKLELIKQANFLFGENNWNIHILTLNQYKNKKVDKDILDIIEDVKNGNIYLLIDDLDTMLPKILSDYLKASVSDATTTIYMTNSPPHDDD